MSWPQALQPWSDNIQVSTEDIMYDHLTITWFLSLYIYQFIYSPPRVSKISQTKNGAQYSMGYISVITVNELMYSNSHEISLYGKLIVWLPSTSHCASPIWKQDGIYMYKQFQLTCAEHLKVLTLCFVIKFYHYLSDL